jgi:hypothetical protein
MVIEDKVALWRQGFMLGSTKPGTPQLVSSRVQDISNITPTDYSYSGWSPLTERNAEYEALTFGMGESLQQANETRDDRRYLWAEAVDASVWPWCKGPELTLLSPSSRDSVAGAVQFFELGGVLYSANGRYVLRRDSDAAWTMVKDFGAGISVLNVAVFQSNFDGVERAFIALSSGVAQWTANGTAYTSMPTFNSLGFAVIGREFWWADDVNRLRKCDTNADPTLEANYTNLIYRAGDKSSRITSLMVSAAGTLVVAKTDGLYTLDAAGQDHSLFPALKFADDPSNGRFWGQFENSLYTSYGYSLGRIDTDLSWTDVGPEKLVGNSGPVSGRVTAFAGVGTMFAYAAILNRDTQTGYLCKFGAWAQNTSPTLSTSVQVEAIHIDAWHGSVIAPLANRAIQTLFVSSVGAPANHTRTYLGLSDGTLGWVVNACAPNPVNCTSYRFHTGDAFIQLPTFHGGFHASIKSLRNVAVTGPFLNTSNYVQLEYKDDPKDTSFTVLPQRFDSSTYELQPVSPMGSGVLFQFRVHLVNTTNTTSPQVSAVAIGHALRPPRLMQFEVDVLCADGLVRRDGVPVRIGRRKIQSLIENVVDNPGSVSVTLPDETVQELSFIDLKVIQAFDEVGREWRGSLHIVAVQHVTSEIEV